MASEEEIEEAKRSLNFDAAMARLAKRRYPEYQGLSAEEIKEKFIKNADERIRRKLAARSNAPPAMA